MNSDSGVNTLSRKPKITIATYAFETDLEPLYHQGMTGYGKDNKVALNLIQKAVQKTGLSTEEVKRWIDNYKKKMKRREGPFVPSPKPSLRKKRGLDVYLRETLAEMKDDNRPQALKLRDANLKWSSLAQEDKDVFCARASELSDQQPAIKQAPRVKDVVKKLQKLNDELQQAGALGSLMVIIDDKGSMHSLGSEKCTKWWEAQQSSQYCLMATCYDEAPVARDDNKALRQEVQAMFNSKYREASGTQKCCPYGKMERGAFYALGLPAGITLKRPSCYGKAAMEKILTAQDDIQFVISEQRPVMGNDQPSTSDMLMQVLDTSQVIPENGVDNGMQADVENNIIDHVVDQEDIQQEAGDSQKREVQVILDGLMRGGTSAPDDTASVTESDHSRYTVEEIVEDRFNEEKGTTEFLVKWENFSESANTWEPEVNLPTELIDQYNKQHVKKEGAPKRRKVLKKKPKVCV